MRVSMKIACCMKIDAHACGELLVLAEVIVTQLSLSRKTCCSVFMQSFETVLGAGNFASSNHLRLLYNE